MSNPDSPKPASSEPQDTAEEVAPDVLDASDNVEAFPNPAAARVAELEATVEELRGRLRAVSAAYQKNQDEVAAARTRLERAAALREELRRGEVVTTLFEPVQNLRRSVDAARRGGTLEDLTKGLEMVLHQAMEGFQKLGLEEVPGKGARFDPRIHDAITTMPVADPALDNIVMEVFSVGYRIGDRVIEPAKVIIGLHDEPANEA
jgi:molecular chaperone GrpE